MQEGRIRRDEEAGVSLVELLVVILIIAILAAIAIPLFLRQRERGWAAQVQSSLKNAALAAEAASSEPGGYAALNDDGVLLLEENGFTKTDSVEIGITATESSFCIAATHEQIPAGRPWWLGTYSSEDGHPVDGASDIACPDAVLLAIAPGITLPADDTGTGDTGTGDTGTGDPGTGDPGTTDPGTGDPGTTDPGTGDPGTTDPGTGNNGTGNGGGPEPKKTKRPK